MHLTFLEYFRVAKSGMLSSANKNTRMFALPQYAKDSFFGFKIFYNELFWPFLPMILLLKVADFSAFFHLFHVDSFATEDLVSFVDSQYHQDTFLYFLICRFVFLGFLMHQEGQNTCLFVSISSFQKRCRCSEFSLSLDYCYVKSCEKKSSCCFPI